MKNIFPIIAAALATTSIISCSSQKNDTLSLKIKTSEAIISMYRDSMREPCINSCSEIQYQLTNNSNHSILLYGIKDYIYFGYPDELACDSVNGMADFQLYILTDSMTCIDHGLTSSLENDRANPSAFPDTIWRAPDWFRNTRVALKAGETMDFTQTLDFRGFRTRGDMIPGIYNLVLKYHQKKKNQALTIAQIDEDLKEADAILFEGCLESSIKLIVR